MPGPHKSGAFFRQDRKQRKGGMKMADKVGTLIREARTKAGFTQEQLARKIKGISADDISKAERGEKDLTQAALKEIAKATGVTQKSLIDAAKGGSAAKKTASKAAGSKTASSKTAAKKTASSGTAAKKTASSKTSAKKTASSGTAAKKTASSGTAAKKTTAKRTTSSRTELKLSAEEKKLVKAYREADDRMKAGVKLLLLGTDSLATEAGAGDMLGALLGGIKEMFGRREIQ